MRRDVQEIFRLTPHEKQVMMFSATLSKEIRPVCRKFMQDVSDVVLVWELPKLVDFDLFVNNGSLDIQLPFCIYVCWLMSNGCSSLLSPWRCLWMMRPS